jgi:hypothetical protein
MSLSPRERDILENIENLLQDADPELAARLTGMRRANPARPARSMLLLTGVGSAVIVPIVIGVRYFRDRQCRSWPPAGSPSVAWDGPAARAPLATRLKATRKPARKEASDDRARHAADHADGRVRAGAARTEPRL